MTPADDKKSENVKSKAAPARLREQGGRLILRSIPNVCSPAFQEEAHKQSLIVARSAHAEADQAFIDAISE